MLAVWRALVIGWCVPCRNMVLAFMRSFARPMLPPVCWPWMVMMPDDHLALMPVTVMIQPHPHGPARAKRNVESVRPRWPFDINDFGSVNGDINHIAHRWRD